MAHTLANAVAGNWQSSSTIYIDKMGPRQRYMQTKNNLMLTLWCYYLYDQHQLITEPRQWMLTEMFAVAPNAFCPVELINPLNDEDDDDTKYYIKTNGGIRLAHDKLEVRWKYQEEVGRLNTRPEPTDFLWQIDRLREVRAENGDYLDEVEHLEPLYAHTLVEAIKIVGISHHQLRTSVDERIAIESKDRPTV